MWSFGYVNIYYIQLIFLLYNLLFDDKFCLVFV